MAASEHYRAAQSALPRLPLAAIVGFAIVGLAGSVFLTYATFSHDDVRYSTATTPDVPVYSARAVPFDRPDDQTVRKSRSAATESASGNQDGRGDGTFLADGEAAVSTTEAFGEAVRDLRGSGGSSDYAGANIYLAKGGAGFGISAQSSPQFAPDGETLTSAPVPEASTWLCGLGLIALVAGRGVRASWHRNRRRADQ
jgi:hypothetical protein